MRRKAGFPSGAPRRANFLAVNLGDSFANDPVIGNGALHLVDHLAAQGAITANGYQSNGHPRSVR